jgi:hypothetical protein
MAFENFKPTIWTTGIQHNFPKVNVFSGLANRAFEGECAYGNKAKISSVGEVTTSAYTGTVTYKTLDDFSLEVLIDQKKYFAVEVDDVDKVQSKPALMQAAQIEIGKAVADDPDYYMSGLYTQAGLTHASTGTPTAVTSANLISTLGTIRDKLRDNKVRGDLVAVVPPWIITKIDYSQITYNTNNSEVLTAGYRGRFMGFDFYESDNIRHSGTTWYAPMFFLRGASLGFIMQLEKVEAGRRDAAFKDYIRGLMVYGAKFYRPDSFLTWYCANAAETTL